MSEMGERWQEELLLGREKCRQAKGSSQMEGTLRTSIVRYSFLRGAGEAR